MEHFYEKLRTRRHRESREVLKEEELKRHIKLARQEKTEKKYKKI
jgi:hypothetical protein